MDDSGLSHSTSEGQLGCFQVLAVMNKHVCAGFCVDIKFQLLLVNSKECNCWIVWWGACLVRNCWTVFQTGCASPRSHQQWMSVPGASHPQQRLVVSVFRIWTLLIGVEWYLIVLLRVSLKTCDVEHLFMCLFDTCMSSLVRCLLRTWVHF